MMENLQIPDQTHPTMHQQSSPVAEPSASLAGTLEEVPQRVREIAMLRGLGYPFRQIAAHFNVTPQAVSLMLTRHQRSFKSLGKATELRTLSARAVNALGRNGIRNREDAVAKNALVLLKGQRNCGRKTLDEIAQWLDAGNGQR